MTKLTYVFTATDGNRVENLTYRQATQLVAKMGGHITAVYTPIVESGDCFSAKRKAILAQRRKS